MITQIQQRPIRKRAMNNQESGVSGRKLPGRRGGAAAGIRVGEIVEVEGGHIIRSTGRKDRHSKVCTAKGPRDRRVRLSAHTAIQFYDVQDRLGYDRPSKAVDWLMIKAKSAIDELEKLPPWTPTASASAGDGVYGGNNDESSNVFLPEMDSDSIPDTINAPAAETAAPAVQFQTYLDGRSQDLRLSLQSFQDSNRNQEQQEEHQSQFGFGWNMAGVGGFMFIPPPPQQPPPILIGHGVGQAATHFFTQRGTLQSNNTPLVRAYIDDEINPHNPGVSVQPMSFPAIGFGPSSGGFSSFPTPARIQSDHDEEQDGNKPSYVASTSRH